MITKQSLRLNPLGANRGSLDGHERSNEKKAIAAQAMHDSISHASLTYAHLEATPTSSAWQEQPCC